MMFASFPDKPDHDALEREILALWEREATFAKLRAKNADGPRFSFFDGPVTANKSLAVHTAWGRTLKDVFQRYKALRGYHQRYQNGFDCQGLWIEVGVERELGLNSKREIEEYGLAEFARKCRDVVAQVVGRADEGLDPARPVDGLGQRLLHVLATRTSSTSGASSQHRPRARLARAWATARPSGARAAARRSRPTSCTATTRTGATRRSTSASRCSTATGEWIVVWTTTPWTLPANVAAAVNPDADYGLLENGEWVAVRAASRTRPSRRSSRAPSSSACATRGRSTRSSPGSQVEHRVIPWDDVALDTGTGIVHIAPGCGGEDFELRKVHDLAVLTPVDESGPLLPRVRLAARPLDRRGGRADRRRPRRPRAARARRDRRAPLSRLLALPHAADLPALRRLVHRGRRAPPAAARRQRDGRVDARLHGQAHGRLAAQHGRLEHLAAPLLRAAAAVLPVRVRPPERDRLAGRARGARARRARPARGAAPPLDRRGPDRAAPKCGEPVQRIEEVGDVWLDAGIVPFSTLGWQNPEYVPEGYATGAAKGLTTADLPDHATGSSGSRPTGSRRCASRSGSGSTRSSSCRSR